MDIIGEARKRRPHRKAKKKVKRKMKTKMDIVVREDSLGKYIIIQGKKFRIGRDVSGPALAEFAVKEALKPSAKPPKKGRLVKISENYAAPEAYKSRKQTRKNTAIDSPFKKEKEETVLQSIINPKKVKSHEQVNAALQEQLSKSMANESRLQKEQEKRQKDAEEALIRNNKIDEERRVRQETQRLAASVQRESPRFRDLMELTQREKLAVASRLKAETRYQGSISKLTGSDLVRKIIELEDLKNAASAASSSSSSSSSSSYDPEVFDIDDDDPERIHLDDSRFFSRENGENEINNADEGTLRRYLTVYRPEIDYSESSLKDLKHYAKGVFRQQGFGMDTSKGLSNFQLDKIMHKFPEYLGTISHDEVISRILPKVVPESRGGFIINTDPLRKPGEHWQAVYWDARPQGEQEINFYDSYGDPIDKELQKDLLLLAQKLNSGTYLKFKENRVKHQNASSSNCGWFSVRFLMDRFRGKRFQDASGWDDAVKSEKNIEKFKTQHGGRFGYIPSFQEGGFISLPRIRSYYPPSVRKYLVDTPITSITVCRDPISSGVNKLLNIVSLGGWQKALQAVGIDKALHLYMVINGNTVLERNHVISMHPGGRKSAETECMNVPLYGMVGKLTFRQLLDRTASAVGPSLQRYDGRTNSCQVFLSQVLRANGLGNNDLNKFINQDLEAVFKNLPRYVEPIAKVATDLAHRLDTAVRGNAKIREIPPDPPSKNRSGQVQSIMFDKQVWTPIKAKIWLDKHDFHADEMDDKKNFYRYRQFEPIEGDEFRTLKRKMPEGVEMVVEWAS